MRETNFNFQNFKMKRAAGLLILAFFLLILVAPVLAQDGKTIDQIAAEQKVPVAEQVANFYNWAVGISALVALGILVYAGLSYTVAGGNVSRQGEAKQWIWNALIGLGLLFGSYIILNTINPDLTKLQGLDLSQVKTGATQIPTVKNLDLSQLVSNFYQWALGIGGLVALGILVFGGILYTISPGNSSRQGEAKTWIFSALLGLALLFGSYAILYTINPDLTKLANLKESLVPNKEAETTTSQNQIIKVSEDKKIKFSDLINAQLGRKDLASTGVFENWNCGGSGGGGNLYGGACSLTESRANCDELQRNGVDCPEDIFVSIFDLIGSPPGLLKVPVPSKVVAPFLPGVGFNLPSISYREGGNCQLKLNPVLVDNIAELKRRVPECTASTRCFVQPDITACTAESVNNNRGHPIHSHLELRAVDLVTSGKNRGLASPPKEWEEKDKAILEFLGQSNCVQNLIAPSRLNEPDKSLCRENGEAVECAGIKDNRGNEEEIIHYDVSRESDCEYAKKYAQEIDLEKLAKGVGQAGVSGKEAGDETTEEKGPKAGEKVPLGIAPLIGNFYKWALGIGGLIALGVLIFGGILYTISAGNASKQEDAKNWLLGAVMGMLFLAGSYLILNTVNPELTKLKDLELIVNEAAQSLKSGSFTFSGTLAKYPDCNGAYHYPDDPRSFWASYYGNFADPPCEVPILASSGKYEASDAYKNALLGELKRLDPVNANHWFNKVIPHETGGTYSPNAVKPDSECVRAGSCKLGACGLFQMRCEGPADDYGGGLWREQAANAIRISKQPWEGGRERKYGYWPYNWYTTGP